MGRMNGRERVEPLPEEPRSGSGRRAQLLSIAARLFAEQGFTATTVREIAEQAGILSGSLYHHFASKEEMVDEILRSYLGAQLAAFRRVTEEGGDPRQELTGLIRVSFAALPRHRRAMAILHHEGDYLAGFATFEYLGRADREFERIWVRVLRDGQRRGVFRPELNPGLAHRLIRDSVSSAVRWYNPTGRTSARAIAEHYTRIFCDGVVLGERE
ncbi:TetR family transcriptional regulator [Actinopolyspora mortivallis]|uniref:TetR family transcriptional regulator n=2 Tax=Actinopolyspora mortivallis TaxID=33906 RepID=A0A2T0GT80_ACTMO|nr:TetR family transcriptional regulator [Actinopolyspora mortivallis]